MRYTITPIKDKYLVESWIGAEYQDEIGTYDTMKEASSHIQSLSQAEGVE